LTTDFTLYLLLAVLALLALAPILISLLRKPRRQKATATPDLPLPPVEEGAALWREQRLALDEELSLGLIGEGEHKAALAALAQAAKSDLAAPADAVKQRPEMARSRRAWLGAGLALLVLALAIPLYLGVGRPDARARMAEIAPQTADAARAVDPQVLAMVQSLAKKLAEHPEDANGFRLLGRSYMVIGNYAGAASAYRHVLTLDASDAQSMVDLADARAMQEGGSLSGEPSQLIAKALVIDPKNPKALELEGTAALQRNDAPAARDAWRKLRAVLPADSPDVAQLDNALAQLDAAIDGRSGRANAKVAQEPAASGEAMAPEQGAQKSVSGTLDIAPALTSQVSLADVVYIVARPRDAKAQGSRMPLAVMRLEARQLPAPFTLSDAMAMDPAHKISDVSSLVIEAHIAKHGTPITTAGDLAAAPVQARLGDDKIHLVIDHVVP
jgi:cytochrome c-type biogenesis protein CcmH